MLAKKGLVKLVVLLIAGTAILSAACFAAEEAPGVEQPKPSGVKVQGVVNVTKDANDVITNVTLAAKDGVVHNVVLDAKGLELGEKMANKEVEVHGIASEKDGQRWIEVSAYKPVEAPKTE